MLVSYTVSLYMFTDTASVYKNESFIGEAVKDVCRKFGIDEKEVKITSKLGLSQSAIYSIHLFIISIT